MKKLSYLYEIPVFYLAICIFNFVFAPQNPAFIDINPHPYWLGILLFGFRYGVSAGTTSGIVSALLYMTGNWFYGEKFLFEDVNFYLLPSFFIVVGASVGLGVNRYLQKNELLQQQIHNLKHNNNHIKQELITQNVINAELEKKIVSKMSTMVTLYQGAQQLESIELQEVYNAVLGFFSKTLDVNAAALYLKKETGWNLYKSFGWESEERWTKHYGLNEGLVGLSGSENRIVSIKDILGPDFFKLKDVNQNTSQQDLNKECLVASPLKNGEKGEVIAVYAIQNMALININSATINLLSFLTSWASRAIHRALYFEELKSQEILDPEFNIYSYNYFLTRLKQEFVKSQTYYLPLSILLIKMIGIDALNANKKKSVLMATSQLLKESCRDIDVIAKCEGKNFHFACMLSTLSETQSVEIKNKISQNFEKLKIDEKIALKLGTGSFSPQVKSMQELLGLAESSLVGNAL